MSINWNITDNSHQATHWVLNLACEKIAIFTSVKNKKFCQNTCGPTSAFKPGAGAKTAKYKGTQSPTPANAAFIARNL